MDTFYKMFPQPVTVKTEVNTDIIDLETEIATPKDIVINWDKEVRRRLLCCLYPGNGNLFDDLMKSYVMLLKDKVVQFKDKQLLREKLLTHITIFNSHYRDVEGEFDEFVNYFDHMEEILTVYCNVELEINRHAPKPENVPNRYLKKVKSTSQRICRVLYNNLAHKTLHIIHVLLKMNYKHTNPVCQSVMKMIYRHFLLKPSIGTISDEEFCRYYLVFQRWKEISKDDEIKKMENIFSLKFKKAPDFCETNEIMKTILTPANYSITGIFTHIMDYRNAPIRAYFDYIKKKRIDEISTIVIDVDKATTNIETSENECSRLYNEISHSFSKEVVSSPTTKEAETEVTPLCIDSDSDDDVIETTESTGVCVIDDSDQDSIEYVYLENAATKKHKSRKKATSLPVTSVIDLDCYVPPASTSRESSPSHLRDTASSPPTSRSSITVPPPSSPSRSSLTVPPPSPSLPQASSEEATLNVNTPLASESTFCDKLSDRVTVDAPKDITRCSTTYKQTQPTYKTVEIQTDLVTTYPYYYGLVTPPSDQRLDENNPDIDMLQENQASEINMELTRSRTDSENAQSDASFNDHNEIDMDDAPTTNPNLKMVIKKVETVTLNTQLDASFANLAINKNEVQAIDVAESVQSDKQNMDMAHESESDRDQSDMYESHPNSENDNYDSENQENLLDQSFESEETIIQSSVMKKEGCFDTKLLKTEDARNRKNDHGEVVTNLPEDTLNENVNSTNDNNDNVNETVEVQMNESCNVENMNVVEDIPECEINADVQPAESTVPANETQCKLAEENLQQTKLPVEDIVDVPNITENNRTVKDMTNIIEDSLDKCDDSLKTKMVQNNKLNDKKVQKVMYTSESIRDTSLDTFSKFEDEMFSQLMSSNTNEFDDVLNGPVSVMNGLNCKNQFFENSNDNFDLFGFVKNQSLNSFGLGNGMRNSKKSPSVSRSNSPTDSPAYEEIDTNDFRHYMEQGEINLLGDGKSEQPGNSKQDSRKTRGILHKGVEEETLNHHGNQKRKRSRQVNKKRSVVFCEVVDTRFVESRSEEEGLDYSNFRYVKRNNIKCFIDPDDVKLTQDSRVVFELGFCETYLSKQNQCMNEPSQANYIFNRPKHNTVKTSILQRIDFDKTDKAGTRLEDLSAKETEEFFNSASNYVPTTGNNHPGTVDLNTEFSNSPKFLHDSEQLVQQCVAKTLDDDTSQIIDIQPEVTFLSDNSNFYNLKICSESELNMLSENCNLVIEHVQNVDITSLNILGNYESVNESIDVVGLDKSQDENMNERDEIDVVGFTGSLISRQIDKQPNFANDNTDDIPDSIIIKGIDCLNDNIESIKCVNPNDINRLTQSNDNLNSVSYTIDNNYGVYTKDKNESDKLIGNSSLDQLNNINYLTDELYACLINEKIDKSPTLNVENHNHRYATDDLYSCNTNLEITDAPKSKSPVNQIDNNVYVDTLKFVSDNAVYYPSESNMIKNLTENCKVSEIYCSQEFNGLNKSILQDLGKNVTTWTIRNSINKNCGASDSHSLFVNEVNKSDKNDNKDKKVSNTQLTDANKNSTETPNTNKITDHKNYISNAQVKARDEQKSTHDTICNEQSAHNNYNCNENTFNLLNQPIYNFTYTPTIEKDCRKKLDNKPDKHVEPKNLLKKPIIESYSPCAYNVSISENSTNTNLFNQNALNANLANANLTCANLTNVNFSSTNLANVNFINTNLTKMNLTNTNLMNISLSNKSHSVKKAETHVINTHSNVKYLNDCSKLTQRKANEKIVVQKAPQKRKTALVVSKKTESHALHPSKSKISVKENLCDNLMKEDKSHETVPIPSHHSPSTSNSMDEEIDFNKIYTELNDIELNHLIESLNSGSETRLPFKKRRMSVNVKQDLKKEEISYPATPMISIAELEALQNKTNTNRPFKTPAERKEMPPLPVYFNVNSEPSPIITDQFNINNHTYNNPTINYHMSNMPMPFIPCASYFPLPPILLPFNNLPTFDHNKTAQDVSCGKTNQPQPFKPVKKEKNKEKSYSDYC